MLLVKLDTGFNIEVEFSLSPFHKRFFAWLIDMVIQGIYLWIASLLFSALIVYDWFTEEWLLVIRHRILAARLTEHGVKLPITRAVVLRLQAIYVNATGPNGESATDHFDLEPIGRFTRHDTSPHDIHRLGAPAAVENLRSYIPVRIELDPTLLHQHAAEIVRGLEALSAEV